MNRNITPFNTNTEKLPEGTACPNCGKKLDVTEGFSVNNEEGRNPVPGDISVCIGCGIPCKFGEGLSMEKLDEKTMAEVMRDESLRMFCSAIKERKRYSEMLDKMSADARQWMKNHPDKSPAIQYNFPKEACVVAGIDDAIDNNFVSINEDARQMLRELGWLDKTPKMPTVLMVRTVLEHTFK